MRWNQWVLLAGRLRTGPGGEVSRSGRRPLFVVAERSEPSYHGHDADPGPAFEFDLCFILFAQGKKALVWIFVCPLWPAC
jgi:hypothetical protein